MNPEAHPTVRRLSKRVEGVAKRALGARFRKTLQELQEFKRNEQVRLVPHIRLLAGGHRFRFTAQGSHTRVDHELEMTPKGFFKLFNPLVGMIGRKNLRRTADALQKYLEGSTPLEK